MGPNLRMARDISSQYVQTDLKPFNARAVSSIDQNPVPENFPSEVIVFPQYACSHRTHIVLKDGFELVFEFEYIECPEAWTDLHDHVIVAVRAVIASGTRAEEIHGGDMMSAGDLSDNIGQLFDRVIPPEQIAEHDTGIVSTLK